MKATRASVKSGVSPSASSAGKGGFGAGSGSQSASKVGTPALQRASLSLGCAGSEPGASAIIRSQSAAARNGGGGSGNGGNGGGRSPKSSSHRAARPGSPKQEQPKQEQPQLSPKPKQTEPKQDSKKAKAKRKQNAWQGEEGDGNGNQDEVRARLTTGTATDSGFSGEQGGVRAAEGEDLADQLRERVRTHLTAEGGSGGGAGNRSAGLASRLWGGTEAGRTEGDTAKERPVLIPQVQAYSDLFEEVIERDRLFGSTLRQVKGVYDSIIMQAAAGALSAQPLDGGKAGGSSSSRAKLDLPSQTTPTKTESAPQGGDTARVEALKTTNQELMSRIRSLQQQLKEAQQGNDGDAGETKKKVSRKRRGTAPGRLTRLPPSEAAEGDFAGSTPQPQAAGALFLTPTKVAHESSALKYPLENDKDSRLPADTLVPPRGMGNSGDSSTEGGISSRPGGEAEEDEASRPPRGEDDSCTEDEALPQTAPFGHGPRPPQVPPLEIWRMALDDEEEEEDEYEEGYDEQ